jgi:glycine/D-amino acid oxidase-like deaminating enzyme
MQPIEQSCFWLATRNKLCAASEPIRTELSASHRAHIVIVGAGFTGLWTAYFLKELQPDLEIVVVEQGATGYGASGRNAGMISNCIDHSHHLAIAHFGLEEARRLAAVGLANIKELSEFAQDCDLELNGQLAVALTEAHLAALPGLLKAAEMVEISGYELLDGAAVQKRLASPLYLGGAFLPGGGIINPIKLVDRLAGWLKARGVTILEGSKVTTLSAGKLEIGEQSIFADKIILATDAYTHKLLPGLLHRFIPLYDYILVSHPLNETQLACLGWQGREGVTDCRNFFNYYRLTADDRVLWGTSEAQYYPPHGVGEQYDHSESHYRRLKESFARHFPQLKDIVWSYGWGGPIASTTRLTPFFGSAYNDTVLYALGYTGHGLGSTRVAAKILAHMALKRPSELLKLKLVTNKPMPYPPEPLRSLAVNMVTGALRQVDQGKTSAASSMLLSLLDRLGIGFSS